MGLFYRRPLCFFAFLFVAFSLLAFLLDVKMILVLFGVLSILLTAFCIAFGVVHSFKAKKKKIFCLTGILSLLVAMLAVGHSFLNVAFPSLKAERLAGEHRFVAEITEVKYRAGDYARYSVNLLQVEEKSTKVSATLSCYSSTELAPKDRIFAVGELLPMEERDRDGALLSVALEEDAEIYFQRTSEQASAAQLLSSPSGILVLSDRCQSFLRERMLTLLGERNGSLAAAFFVGDRSSLSDSVVRDFGRSGVSHLMAVSGLHFSILLGALDGLLRKLFCPKKGRLVLVTLASIFFLFLTGFSMSACRSALMLYALYLTFFFQEESDSVTSLFCSFALIVLISPYAIVDVGLWMSFLATLGLLTLYPMISEKIPRSKHSKWWIRGGLRIARNVLMLVLMTTIATLFLLPILWIFWGEVSTVSLLVNPILSLVSTVFLVGIPIWLALSFIPWIGAVIAIPLGWLAESILGSVHFFSTVPSATISLNYEFCRFLIPIFSAVMIAGLVIRLRRKWLVLLPPMALILAFSICFLAVRVGERTPSVRCISSQGNHDVLWISDGEELAICDLSGGSSELYRQLLTEISESTATEIQSLVLTHYHRAHRFTVNDLLQSERVRTLYLPTPHNKEARAIAAELWYSAIGAGSEVVFYEGGELPLTEQITAEIFLDSEDPFSVALTLVGRTERLTYLSHAGLSSCDENALLERFGASRTILIGSHGSVGEEPASVHLSNWGSVERVIYFSEQRKAYLHVKDAEHYVATPDVWWEIALP